MSGLLDKLKGISEESVTMSKNTEKQISQSINFSQKEHDFIVDTIFYIADLLSLNIEG